MIFRMKKVERLKLPSGEEPFKDWIESLELKARARIYSYIDRVAMGGDKNSQSKDIPMAKNYWRRYVQK